MKTLKRALGDLGESYACGYLEKKGFCVLARNYRTKFGEIDILAKTRDKTLVFIEVKTMRAYDLSGNSGNLSYPQHQTTGNLDCRLSGDYPLRYLTPEDQLSPRKLERCTRIAQWYANNNPKLVSGNGYRIDLVTLLLDEADQLVNITHYENIS